MLGDAERARAPVAASSAKQGHRVLHAPCSAHLAELARSSAAAAITTVTTIVLQEDYIPTRVKGPPCALSESLEWRTLAHCRQWARNRWCAHIRALQRARGRALVQADGPDAFQLRSACSCACAALLATGPLSRPANS